MSRADKAGYAAAVVILVVGGAVARTVVLNWISGPFIVVACVAIANAVADRLARRNEC